MSKIEIDNVDVVLQKTVNRFGTITGLLGYVGRAAKIVIIQDQEDRT